MAILQQLRNMQHNPNVTNSTPDPPPTLKDAEEKFSTFLASQDYLLVGTRRPAGGHQNSPLD
jgi:hypothetical protein